MDKELQILLNQQIWTHLSLSLRTCRYVQILYKNRNIRIVKPSFKQINKTSKMSNVCNGDKIKVILTRMRFSLLEIWQISFKAKPTNKTTFSVVRKIKTKLKIILVWIISKPQNSTNLSKVKKLQISNFQIFYSRQIIKQLQISNHLIV